MNSSKEFQKILKQLNPKQRQAVDTIEGPVLVIAGPGTGKTHILSARIGNILLQTDTAPENILCLTYTDAGTVAMRERLVQFIGPTANKVHIHTFHSFCNSVIKAFPSNFGSYDLEPISELEKKILIRELLDTVPLDSPLMKGMNYQYANENQVIGLFDFMKKENIDHDMFTNNIKTYIDDLPNRPEYRYKKKYGKYQAGDLKEALYNKEVDKMAKLKAAVDLYPEYLKAMTAANRYDYADMILWVIDAFKKDEGLLGIYQEQFQYVLVDEFQDTSGAQMEVLELLIDYWERPNVFAVGDDDQCIYEFQGARLRNIEDFVKKYEDIQIILLEENYRSTQDILDVCGRSIAFNQKRLVHSSGLFGNEKVLKASNTSLGASHPKPVIKAYENHFYELTDLVNQIQTLIATGVKPSEIAVLYRKHAQSEALMTLLSDRDMVYSTKRTINVLHEPIIRNVRILLSYVAQQYEDFNAEDNLLFRLLHLPFFDTQSLDLAKLGFYLSSLSMDEDAIPWRVAISDSMLLEQLKIESPNSLLQVGNLIDDWTKSMDSYSLQGFVEYILTSSGVLNYILEHRDRDWNIQLLTTFYNYIKAEIRKNPLLKLADLMNTIDLMDQTGVALPYHKTIYTNDGINLLTAHGAKGLEFENVFLLEVTKDRWQSNRGGGFQFSYPDTITQTSKEDAAESQRRLFYVAMSRAKTHLQISYPEYSDTEKKLQRAGFIDEIEATGFHQVYPDVNNEDVVETQIALLSQALKPKIALPLESLITERLEQFRMSPSALNSYLACPINFFYNYILKVPSIQSEPASYGMAMHAALEKLFNKMLSDDDKAFMESEELIASFEAYMVRQRGAFSTKGFDFHFAKGKKNLVMLYDKKVDEWEKKVETEKFINDVAMSGVPLKGTIDKIEFMGSNLVRLVDYKSGKFDKKRVAAPNDKNPEGGPYWRQLVFYKLLFEGSSYANGRKAQSAMIAYVDSNREDQFDEYAVEFDPDQESKLIEILTATYAKIMNHEFDEGCEEERCQWCQFVKDSKLDVSSEIGFAVVDEDMIRDE